MILSYRDLYVDNNKVEESNVEESQSLLLYSLSCISESDKLIREIVEDTFNLSSNSTNPIIAFNESFSFGDIIKSIIDFFVETIKKVYRNFKALLSKIFGGDKVLEKYKSELLNYNKALKVYFEHYNYSNLDVDIPPSSLISIFQEEYDILYESLEKITGIKEKAVIISKLNELSNSISKDDNYFNILRRNILSSAYEGNKSVITEGDFIRELKLLFRNNMEKASKEDIPSYEVRKSAEIFFNSKNLKDNIKNQSKQIEKTAYELKQKLEKITPATFLKEYQPIDYDIEFALNRLLKLKSDRMSKACNIIVIAYSEKLQSVKDAIIQYKKVLHDAVKELIKEGE